jgi:release factor glutamine methyltransferase
VTAIRQLLVDVERRLAQAGIESARTDAELLLTHVLKISRTQLLLVTKLEPEQLHEYEVLVRRRVLREPLQYITGLAPFRRIELTVGPGVLVPRPETELIIDIVKRFGKPGNAIDLGSGSGCIALSMAVEISELNIFAIESSPEALTYLNRNVEMLQKDFSVGSTVVVLATEMHKLPELSPELIGKVAVMVANPPYVPTNAKVADEVQYFEPPVAVFAANNGYELIDQVIELAETFLMQDGLLVIEHHETQGKNGTEGGVFERIRRTGKFKAISVVDDLTGRPRFTYATREMGS